MMRIHDTARQTMLVTQPNRIRPSSDRLELGCSYSCQTEDN